jgi:hypothetical protein
MQNMLNYFLIFGWSLEISDECSAIYQIKCYCSLLFTILEAEK